MLLNNTLWGIVDNKSRVVKSAIPTIQSSVYRFLKGTGAVARAKLDTKYAVQFSFRAHIVGVHRVFVVSEVKKWRILWL